MPAFSLFTRFPRSLIAATAGAAVLLGAPGTGARADVKVVQERTLTGLEEMGARGVPTTYVLYFKGDRFREEYQGRSTVHIYDAVKDRYYTLNRTDQTYMVQTLEDALKQGGSSALQKVTFKGMATISEGGSTRTIAGKPATNYTVQTSVNLIDPSHGLSLMNVKLEGDQWTTKSIPFPSKNPNIFRLAYLFAPRASRLLQPYYEKVSQMQGIPLSFDYIVTMSGVVNGTFEAHADVKSISQAKIPDYMFKVPPGYRLVDKVAEED